MKRLTREQRVDMALATLGYPVGGDNIRVVLEKLVSDIKTQDKADCEARIREIFECIDRLCPHCAVLGEMNTPCIVPLEETTTYKYLKAVSLGYD
jgi:hypothetical protein